MNLRCFYCQTPFTLGTEEKITALKKMHAEDLHHYDAHCPRCGRANPVWGAGFAPFAPLSAAFPRLGVGSISLGVAATAV